MIRELAEKSRSWRGYDESRAITKEELCALVECARRCPAGNGAPLDVFGTLVLPLEWRRVCRELLELQKGCEGPFGSSRG